MNKILTLSIIFMFSFLVLTSAGSIPKVELTTNYTLTTIVINGTSIPHNDLNGIQGGTTDEYYHLTDAEHTSVLAGIVNWIDNTVSDLVNYFTKTEVLAQYYNKTDIEVFNSTWSSTYNTTYNTWAYNMTTPAIEYADQLINTTFFNATSVWVVSGTASGSLGDIQTYNGVSYNVTEVSSDYDLRINFSVSSTFNELIIRYKSSLAESHITNVYIWDYEDSDWESYGILGETSNYGIFTFPVFDASEHLDGGVIQVRINTENVGALTHEHFFDWVTLSKGIQIASSTETDPFSVHRDGLLPLTGDWNVGGYNITNINYEQINRLSVGSNKSLGAFHLHTSATNLAGAAVFSTSAESAGNAGQSMIMYVDDGQPMGEGDKIGQFVFGGASDDAGSLKYTASVTSYATENWSGNTNRGTKLTFEGTPTGVNTARQKWLTLLDGMIAIGGDFDPEFKFHIRSEEAPFPMYIDVYNDNGSPGIAYRSARGTASSPTATQADDIISSFVGYGYGATGFSSSSRTGFTMRASENWDDSNQGTYTTIVGTSTGGTTTAEWLRLINRNMGLGTTFGSVTPQGDFHIRDADPVLILQDTETSATSAISTIKLGESGGSYSMGNFWKISYDGMRLTFSNGNDPTYTERVSIASDGKTGIGTDSPRTELDVAKYNKTVGPTITLSNTISSSDWNPTDTIGRIDFVSTDTSITSQPVRARMSVVQSAGSSGTTYITRPEFVWENSVASGDLSELMRLTYTGQLQVNGSSSGISIYALGNISATGYITRTDVYEKERGSALNHINDASEYITPTGEINHSAFGYSSVSYEKEVVDKTEIQCGNEDVIISIGNETQEEVRENKIVCRNITTYKTAQEEGVDLVKEVSLLKQAVYELKVQNEQLQQQINILTGEDIKLYANDERQDEALCSLSLFGWCISK